MKNIFQETSFPTVYSDSRHLIWLFQNNFPKNLQKFCLIKIFAFSNHFFASIYNFSHTYPNQVLLHQNIAFCMRFIYPFSKQVVINHRLQTKFGLGYTSIFLYPKVTKIYMSLIISSSGHCPHLF